MANLQLIQCDNCGYSKFATAEFYSNTQTGFSAAVREFETASEYRICSGCLDHLKSRKGMYELTGDAAEPSKIRTVWPPNAEQNEHPDRCN